MFFYLQLITTNAALLDTPERSFMLLGMLTVFRLNTMISTTSRSQAPLTSKEKNISVNWECLA
jgi:hypothetical protein